MKCPKCNQYLIKDSQDCYFCQHGMLVSGKFISKAKSSHTKFNIEVEDSTTNKSSSKGRILKCPNCASSMTEIDYLNTGIHIDTCTNCHYRWLDDGELENIRSIKPKLSGEELLFVSGIEAKMQKEQKFNDTKIPYFNLARFLSAVSYSFGDKRSTGPTFIMSLGIYGAIKLLITPIGRIFLLIVIVSFGILAWNTISFMT